jgi:tripartite-type tricarboxylate transporter receptor subunit TctC
MRLIPSLLGIALGMSALLGPALAQDAPRASTFPNKPIRIVVPYAPGGFTDIVSRLIGQKLTTRLGQPVIVENKAGASTILGAEMVAKAPADGYTLLMAVTTTLSTNPFLFKKLPYKSSDFTPVALTGLTPFLLLAHPSVPASNVEELKALEKSKPGSLNVATLGNGASTQLVAEMFTAVTGVKLTPVPYKGAGPALSDLIAGHVQLYFDGIATGAPNIRSGRLKGIALAAETRSSALPSLPTFAELGYPKMIAQSWYGLLAPAGTPPEVVMVLNKAVNEALLMPDVHARVVADGAEAPVMSPRQFGELIDSHTKVWEAIIKPLNIQLD